MPHAERINKYGKLNDAPITEIIPEERTHELPLSFLIPLLNESSGIVKKDLHEIKMLSVVLVCFCCLSVATSGIQKKLPALH